MHSLLATVCGTTPTQWGELSRAGGLVRLVLRIMDWYTSCSSLNLPSAEYAGDTNVNWQPLVSWFVFQ